MTPYGTYKETDEGLIYRDIGIWFDAVDLDNEYFTKNTDLGKLTGQSLYYHHGRDPVIGHKSIGDVLKIESDAKGVWFESQVQKYHQFYDKIKHLIRRGYVGYSSGSAQHLIRHQKGSDGRTWIEAWPLVEMSLTATPSQPLHVTEGAKSVQDVSAKYLVNVGGIYPSAQELENTSYLLNARVIAAGR